VSPNVLRGFADICRRVPDVSADLPHHLGKIPEGWLDEMIDHATAVARYTQSRNILVGLKQTAASRASSILTTGIDRILTALNDDLTQLLGQVAEIVHELNGAASAEQAVTNDAGAAWKHLTALADD